MTTEIQSVKEELDKRDLEVSKLRNILNNTTLIMNSSNGSNNNNTTIVPSYNNNNNGNLLTPAGALINASPISSGNNALMNSSSYSLTFDETTLQQYHDEDHIENWLSIPAKKNRRGGWKKLYVVLKKNKLLFFNSLREKENSEPYMSIDLEKVYHVRPVTQTDVVRANVRDVAKIFQLLYDVEAVSGSGSGTYLGAVNNQALANMTNSSMSGSSETLSNRKTENTSIVNALLSSTLANSSSNHITDSESVIGSIIATRGTLGSTDDFTSGGDTMSLGSNDSGEKHKDGKLHIKGHKFVEIKYRLPNSCDVCNKPLWDLIKPPLALECQSM